MRGEISGFHDLCINNPCTTWYDVSGKFSLARLHATLIVATLHKGVQKHQSMNWKTANVMQDIIIDNGFCVGLHLHEITQVTLDWEDGAIVLLPWIEICEVRLLHQTKSI